MAAWRAGRTAGRTWELESEPLWGMDLRRCLAQFDSDADFDSRPESHFDANHLRRRAPVAPADANQNPPESGLIDACHARPSDWALSGGSQLD